MAETMKHTPGPWRIEEGTTLIWGACNPDDTSSYGMGYPITECRVTPISNSTWCKAPYADEGEANARLIAAAPDLLGALKEAMVALDGIAKGEGVFKPIEQTIVLALAVIAKAEGRT